MCACEVYFQAKQLQRSLNAWRNRYSKDNPTYKIIMIPKNMMLHPKLRDALSKMIYAYISLGK